MIRTSEGSVRFTLDVEVENCEAAELLAAITGDDEDVLLAGERAMRERSTAYSLELAFEDGADDVTRALRAAAGRA